jgi:hypothetical protein
MERVSRRNPFGNRPRDRDSRVGCDRPRGISKTACNADQIARRARSVAPVLATIGLTVPVRQSRMRNLG